MQFPQISNARKVFRFKGSSVNPLGSDAFFRNKGVVPLFCKGTFEENAREFNEISRKPLKHRERVFETKNRRLKNEDGRNRVRFFLQQEWHL